MPSLEVISPYLMDSLDPIYDYFLNEQRYPATLSTN